MRLEPTIAVFVCSKLAGCSVEEALNLVKE